MATRTRAAAKKAAAPKKAETGAELLGRINPQRRVEETSVCLNANLITEFQREDAKLAEMMAGGNPNRLNPGTAAVSSVDDALENGTADVKAQARKVRKLETAVQDALVRFVFTALNKDEFRALCDNFPPRRGQQLDQVVGYDRDAAMDALVFRSLTSPTFEECTDRECTHDDCGTWQQLTKVINPAEWGELRDTANLANSGVVDAPKSALASLILDKRASTST